MGIVVQRTEYDPNLGYQYYVAFNGEVEIGDQQVISRVPVEVAISLCENGDLADFSFELPKTCRNSGALEFIRSTPTAIYVEPRVYISLPGLSGDTVARAVGRLEMDRPGRIIGMDILWAPPEATTN